MNIFICSFNIWCKQQVLPKRWGESEQNLQTVTSVYMGSLVTWRGTNWASKRRGAFSEDWERLQTPQKKNGAVPSLASHWRGSLGRISARWSCSWWLRWHSCTRHSDTASWLQGAESHQPCSQWSLQNTTFVGQTIWTQSRPVLKNEPEQNWSLRWDPLEQGLGQLVSFCSVRATVSLINARLLRVNLLFGKPRIQELHQLKEANLFQQLDLKSCFTWLKRIKRTAQMTRHQEETKKGWIPASKPNCNS